MNTGVGQLTSTITVFHYGFLICLVLSILFFGLAILLFFRFHMLALLRQRFGIEARRAIEGYNKQNAKTGDLPYSSADLGERTPLSLPAKPRMAFAVERPERTTGSFLRQKTRDLADKNRPSIVFQFRVVKDVLVVHVDEEELF